jgi:hypothetical protein
MRVNATTFGRAAKARVVKLFFEPRLATVCVRIPPRLRLCNGPWFKPLVSIELRR